MFRCCSLETSHPRLLPQSPQVCVTCLKAITLITLMIFTMHICMLNCFDLWDPVDCSSSGTSVHGIFQARILEWVVRSSSTGSSQPKDKAQCLLCLLHWQAGSLPIAPSGKLDTHDNKILILICNPDNFFNTMLYIV